MQAARKKVLSINKVRLCEAGKVLMCVLRGN